MRVIISAAVSVDGYMDDTAPERLVISGLRDWEEVHALRATCDAIMVGAETLRRDNPALAIRNAVHRAQRIAEGMDADLIKVTVSSKGDLPEELRFFTEAPDAKKIVLVGPDAPWGNIEKLSGVARVIRLEHVNAQSIVTALAEEGVCRLLVEGGPRVLDMFFREGVVDEFRLATSRTVTVADTSAPRMPGFGDFNTGKRALYKSMRTVDDMDVSHYIFTEPFGGEAEEDVNYVSRAIEASRRCEKSGGAYSVGCVLRCVDGSVYEGYTHETSSLNHAEEEALTKALTDGAVLDGATIYTSMEPCSVRKSKPVSCCQLILRHGISRVVYAYAEPDCFVECESTAILRRNDIEVAVVQSLAAEVTEINSHIIG